MQPMSWSKLCTKTSSKNDYNIVNSNVEGKVNENQKEDDNANTGMSLLDSSRIYRIYNDCKYETHNSRLYEIINERHLLTILGKYIINLLKNNI